MMELSRTWMKQNFSVRVSNDPHNHRGRHSTDTPLQGCANSHVYCLWEFLPAWFQCWRSCLSYCNKRSAHCQFAKINLCPNKAAWNSSSLLWGRARQGVGVVHWMHLITWRNNLFVIWSWSYFLFAYNFAEICTNLHVEMLINFYINLQHHFNWVIITIPLPLPIERMEEVSTTA